MTFTYDPESPGTNNTTKTRFHIGDTVLKRGILPDGSNFSDEEVELVLSSYSKEADAETKTKLAGAELLRKAAVVWGRSVDYSTAGHSEKVSNIAKELREQADALENDGGGTSAVQLTRADGYSNKASIFYEDGEDQSDFVGR